MNAFKSYLQPSKGDTATSKKQKKSGRWSKKKGQSASNADALDSEQDGGGGNSGDQTPRAIYPAGDFRNQAVDEILDIKCDVMVNWLHQQQLESMWSTGGPGEGVVLKKAKDNFTCCPSDLSHYRGDFYDAVSALNVKVSILSCLLGH